MAKKGRQAVTLLSDSINRSSIQTVWGWKKRKKKKKESTRVGRVALGLTDVSLMFPLVLMLMGKKKKKTLPAQLLATCYCPLPPLGGRSQTQLLLLLVDADVDPLTPKVTFNGLFNFPTFGPR